MVSSKALASAVLLLTDASLAANVTGACFETAPPSQHYALDWTAEGKSFFDNFDFESGFSPTNGAAFYAGKDYALSSGIATADDNHATIHIGKQLGTVDRVVGGKRRHSVRMGTNKRWRQFLAVLKFNHVPEGMGIWPAFWMNGGGLWPNNGEMDFLEVVNHEVSKVSFHTGKLQNRCQLSAEDTNKCGSMPDGNGMNYNCATAYAERLLGCAPNKPESMQTSTWWNSNPGVIAAEVTERFAKIFYIPESEIPSDLSSGSPRPETWNENWVISYFPFAASEERYPGTCPDPANVLAPQQFIFNIEMCGDWAGNTWNPTGSDPDAAAWQQKLATGQCEILPAFAPNDCCSQYVYQDTMDDYISKNAYFDMSYFKVFQLSDGPGPHPPHPPPPTPSPPAPSSAACSAWPGCVGLAGDCCPNAGGMLACCNAPPRPSDSQPASSQVTSPKESMVV